MPASPTASTSRWLFSQPPNARNCMKSRASLRCGCPSFIPPFPPRSGGSGPRRGVWGGGGMWILAWRAGPRYMGSKRALVYNVYVEAGYRRRGLARRIMDGIHDYCREHGIASIALNASRDGRELYDALGYIVAPN